MHITFHGSTGSESRGSIKKDSHYTIDFSEKWYLITGKEQSFDLKKLPLSILNGLRTRDVSRSGLLTVLVVAK